MFVHLLSGINENEKFKKKKGIEGSKLILETLFITHTQTTDFDDKRK